MKTKKLLLFFTLLNIIIMFRYGDLSMKQHLGELQKGSFNFYNLSKFVVQITTIFLFLLIIIKKNFSQFIFYSKENFLFVLYFLSSLFSSLFYSSQVVYSLYYSLTILIPILLAAIYKQLLIKDFQKNKMLFFKIFFILYSIVMISAMLSLLVDFHGALRTSFDYRLQSILIYVGSDGLSWFAYMFLLFYYMLYFKRIKNLFFRYFVLLVPIFIILQTQTRTTIVIIFSILLLQVFSNGNIKSKFLIFTFFLFLAINFEKFFILFSRGEAQIETMSGRVVMWELIYENFWKSPYFGYGHWSGIQDLLKDTEFELISQVHGSFPELIVSVGLVGLFFWFFYIVSITIKVVILYFKRKKVKSYNDRQIIKLLFYIVISYDIKTLVSSEFMYMDQSLVLLLMTSVLIHKYYRMYIKNNKFYNRMVK